MFGLFALGFFAVAASNLFPWKKEDKGSGEGGFLKKLLGGAGILGGLSTLFGGSVDNDKDDKDDKDTKDDPKKTEETVDVKTIKGKALFVMQEQLKEDKDGELKKDYEQLMSCIYDKDGNELDDDKILENLDKNKELKDKLIKNAKKQSEDPKELKKQQEKLDKVTDSQLNEAIENAKKTRFEQAKAEELEELDKKMKEEIEKTDDSTKKSEIESKYSDLKLAKENEYLQKIERASVERQKADLENTTAKQQIEKCLSFKFEDGLDDGDLSSAEDEVRKKAEEALKKNGIDPKVYRKIQDAKADNKEPIKEDDPDYIQKMTDAISTNDDLCNEIEQTKQEKIKELNKSIEELNEKIEKSKKDSDPENTKTEEPKKGEEEPKKEDDNSFEDEDGNTYKKDGDKYIKTDKKGNEEEIDKEKFEKAKENAVEDGKEGDERTDNDDDLEDDDEEKDDSGNVTKESTKDPRKIYKRRTYKRGNKTFKSKSYYNKKGKSITAKEFNEKVANFENKNKTKDESFSITDYLRDKLIVERFYPNDITQFLKDNL
jgi:hypothetical protein